VDICCNVYLNVENVQLYPLCDTCFKGIKELGKPQKYELKERKQPTFNRAAILMYAFDIICIR